MSTCHSVLVPLELEIYEQLQVLRIHAGLRTCDLARLIIEEGLKESSVMKRVEEQAKELGKQTY